MSDTPRTDALIEYTGPFDSYITELARDLERENAALKLKLTTLGNIAVGNWDDETVGKIDALGIDGKTYKDKLRTMFIEQPQQIAALRKDKERLDWLENRPVSMAPFTRRAIDTAMEDSK